MRSSERSPRAAGYSQAAPVASVFALALPDAEPLPSVTRALVDWDGPDWAEIDPATGGVIGGSVRALAAE